MKRFLRSVCLILVFAMVFSTTAYAAETVDNRASNYFMASSVYFWHVSGNSYQIWFDVTAVDTMNKLGVSKIKVERSTDEVDWDKVCTYEMADYSQMTNTNTGHYLNYVPFTATTGYSYRAVVTLYAKKGNGTAEMTETTEVLDLR